MENKNIRTLIFCLAILATAVGCRKFDVAGVKLDTYSPDIALPLVNTEVTMRDLLDSLQDSRLVAANDGALTLVYDGQNYRLGVDTIFQVLPDINPFPMNDSVFKFPYTLPGGTRVDFIDLRKGFVKIAAIIPFPGGGRIELKIPELINPVTNAIFSQTIIAPGFTYFDSFSVAGWRLVPQADTLHFKHKLFKISDGTQYLPYGTVRIGFSELEHKYAEGFLGTGTYPVPRDTVAIDVFNFVQNGSVFFDDPKLRIHIENSFGIPVTAKFSALNAILTNGTVIPLNSPTLIAGIPLNYPTLAERGQRKTTDFVVDASNSDIELIIGQPVKEFEYWIEPILNPTGDTTIVSFLTDSSEFVVRAELELPLYGRSSGVTVLDTFDLDFGQLDKVDYANFKIVSDNGFPLGADLQVYFLETNGTLVDSLLATDQTVLRAAAIGSSGRVLSMAQKITLSSLPAARLEAVRLRARRGVVRSTFYTTGTGSQSVRLYEDYKAKIRVGVVAGVRIE